MFEIIVILVVVMPIVMGIAIAANLFYNFAGAAWYRKNKTALLNGETFEYGFFNNIGMKWFENEKHMLKDFN